MSDYVIINLPIIEKQHRGFWTKKVVSIKKILELFIRYIRHYRV